MATRPARNDENYRDYVRQRLAKLNRIFANASVGDFSERVDVPETEDEFTELFTGIAIMLDVIREKIADGEYLTAELTKHIKELERINRIMVGREVKMRELKKEIAELKAKLGKSIERHD
jgi:methyl-accepting chemotaxis protein